MITKIIVDINPEFVIENVTDEEIRVFNTLMDKAVCYVNNEKEKWASDNYFNYLEKISKNSYVFISDKGIGYKNIKTISKYFDNISMASGVGKYFKFRDFVSFICSEGIVIDFDKVYKYGVENNLISNAA